MKRTNLSTPSSRPEDCIFCGIVGRKAPSNIVYEDDKYIAFLDAFPFSRGHTLVCPKQHGETIWDMTEAEIGELFKVASRVSRAVVAAVGARASGSSRITGKLRIRWWPTSMYT